jgi:coiled-coil domain-containing protein 64
MLPRKSEGRYEPYALEDMISSLQSRGTSYEDGTEEPGELLKQRERDLVLAAELGKALLERNQELTRQSEALAENYASKVEVSP